ncbi:uncharacterized protein BXZ73DRAFT_78254 [Epithele typhae]|uniref:uncharacterized protein n=1 Tax=Epithele typhae TaxID=378194 RepID=UPI00200897C2|nr:uncharacterized protein BXZ73DRAFT_78254 [Epithele typhae]KAH9929118.1 hypothetical protein BXZ73DRAFT_78254 [Epithele typhae]
MELVEGSPRREEGTSTTMKTRKRAQAASITHPGLRGNRSQPVCAQDFLRPSRGPTFAARHRDALPSSTAYRTYGCAPRHALSRRVPRHVRRVRVRGGGAGGLEVVLHVLAYFVTRSAAIFTCVSACTISWRRQRIRWTRGEKGRDSGTHLEAAVELEDRLCALVRVLNDALNRTFWRSACGFSIFFQCERTEPVYKRKFSYMIHVASPQYMVGQERVRRARVRLLPLALQALAPPTIPRPEAHTYAQPPQDARLRGAVHPHLQRAAVAAAPVDVERADAPARGAHAVGGPREPAQGGAAVPARVEAEAADDEVVHLDVEVVPGMEGGSSQCRVRGAEVEDGKGKLGCKVESARRQATKERPQRRAHGTTYIREGSTYTLELWGLSAGRASMGSSRRPKSSQSASGSDAVLRGRGVCWREWGKGVVGRRNDWRRGSGGYVGTALEGGMTRLSRATVTALGCVADTGSSERERRDANSSASKVVVTWTFRLAQSCIRSVESARGGRRGRGQRTTVTGKRVLHRGLQPQR